MEEINYIASNIKFLRTIAGLSQEQLAKEVELNRGNITSYERGVAQPGINALQRIAAFFNTNLVDLIQTDIAKTMDKDQLQTLFSIGGSSENQNGTKTKEESLKPSSDQPVVEHLSNDRSAYIRHLAFVEDRKLRYYDDIHRMANSLEVIGKSLQRIEQHLEGKGRLDY